MTKSQMYTNEIANHIHTLAEQNESPLISVIIPLYNTEKYIQDCLRTVVAQTYSNLDIIVVNDGSIDKSTEIVSEYQKRDSRIRMINQVNSGVSAARNRGLNEANGDYVGFVDSDDWIHPKMFEVLLWLLLENNADMSVINILRTEKKFSKVLPETTMITTYSKDEYLKRFFKIDSQETIYYTYNKLFKRSLLEGNLFPNYKIGEDVISTYKALLNCEKIVTSDLPLYYYRQGSGITKEFNSSYFQLTNVWKDIVGITLERAPEYNEYAQINQARINFTILSEMALSGAYQQDQYQQKKAKLLEELKRQRKLLWKAPISLSRKIMIALFCLHYEFFAGLVKKTVKRKQ